MDFQYPWRIQDCKTNDIKLASGDMYEPCSTIEWSETFEWDVQRNNACDEKLPLLFSENEEGYITFDDKEKIYNIIKKGRLWK